ncbi:hypothetical protein AAE02nite_48210 [Adhaeribacter aerolatus]|uniref:Alcohol acetyltransferase n=1 Tax=Adhaeribacter aerolatus TaxID=670289 RepID=A0A512B5V5_9BACT|nr:hypothetical protein [Adhaeribacter aerolatus]GEO07157.1 hypothetical protein AAE02nite_48210 [Adhaeribacter aerolatus]
MEYNRYSFKKAAHTAFQQQSPPGDFWLRLDNAAKIYPAVKNRELTSVFRISVELVEKVKAKPLLEAIKALENRFPYFKVALKAGFFWYYLEYNNLPIQVKADKDIPCRAFTEKELMYRVLVKENRISVEFSHILTDGTGAFEFLKSLLFTYFEKCRLILTDSLAYVHPSEPADPEEYEDAFHRYFQKSSAPLIKAPEAFHLNTSLRPKPRFNVLIAIIPLKELTEKAKAYQVSITEYLVAVYLFGLQTIYNNQSPLAKLRSPKIIRIEVPINLRKMYATKTMRNFTLYVMPEIDLRLGYYTFEEITKVVYHQMQLETDKKLINKMISRHVAGEKNPFLRSIPLIIKSIVLSKLFALGTSRYSGVITNLGKVNFTPEMNKLIDRFVFVPPPPNKILKVNCGVVGFDNKLVLSFGNITKTKELEQLFFSFLTHQGIPVKIENY